MNWSAKLVWKTDDPQLGKRLRASFESPDANKRVPIDVSVHVAVEKPLSLVARCAMVSMWICSRNTLWKLRANTAHTGDTAGTVRQAGWLVYKLDTLQGQHGWPTMVR